MKRIFKSRPLHIAACVLLFWKGISLVVCMLLSDLGVIKNSVDFFFSTGFASSFFWLIASPNREAAIASLVLICAALLTFWTFFVLLAVNRFGAKAASIALLIICVLDLPITVLWSFSFAWWAIAACIVFHLAIFIVVAMMRRSRDGKSTWIDKVPDSI